MQADASVFLTEILALCFCEQDVRFLCGCSNWRRLWLWLSVRVVCSYGCLETCVQRVENSC